MFRNINLWKAKEKRETQAYSKKGDPKNKTLSWFLLFFGAAQKKIPLSKIFSSIIVVGGVAAERSNLIIRMFIM